MEELIVRSFYSFRELSPERCSTLARLIREIGELRGIRGLAIIAPEGCNASLSGTEVAIEELSAQIREFLDTPSLDHKDTPCNEHPFRQLKVVLKSEIVTTGAPHVSLPEGEGYLSPREWDEMLERADVAVLDTRNLYESQLGKFRGAICPPIENFADFPAYVAQSGIAKDRPILMYCTGGIRCEKASVQMRELGYEQVYQLHGGILRYLEQFPNQKFEGECFVFDERIAVTQELQPSSTYRLCVHCGEPTAGRLACSRCGREGIVCASCAQIADRVSCSKDCAYHLRRVQAAGRDDL